jgi:hypothetical protein
MKMELKMTDPNLTLAPELPFHKDYERMEPFLKLVNPVLQELDPAHICWVDPRENDYYWVSAYMLWALESGICKPNLNPIRIYLKRIFGCIFDDVAQDRPADWWKAAHVILEAWTHWCAVRNRVAFPDPCPACDAVRIPLDHPAMRSRGTKGEWIYVWFYPCEDCGRMRGSPVSRTEWLNTPPPVPEVETEDSPTPDCDPSDIVVTMFDPKPKKLKVLPGGNLE